jgi:hypothetical protein
MSIYESRVSKSVTFILSLKHTLPLLLPELIQIIVRLYWSLYSEPVLILYVSSTHIRSVRADGYWDCWLSSLDKIFEIYPNLRFHEIESDTYNNLIFPKGKYVHTPYFPLVLLVPGPLWDDVVSNPSAHVKLVNGVQHFNICLSKGNRYYVPKYEHNINGHVAWFTDSLNNPDFIAAQNKLHQ